jgi:hypothetical protein
MPAITAAPVELKITEAGAIQTSRLRNPRYFVTDKIF